jgi:D-tyrosyl-tRNA(Tyr) deacylase
MMALVQRVAMARVEIDGQTVGAIDAGLLVLVCAQPEDTPAHADKLLGKVLRLRIFSDAAGKMNLSLQDLQAQGRPAGLLVISQFTLAADLSSGNRPGFSRAAPPELGERMYNHFVAQARASHAQVQTGRFGADMQVHLVNDGPVTIPMQV